MVDVVIVGAGAAGIGAGRVLQAQGVSFVILEASQRIGGRAFTDRVSLPGQWEQGCQWFHCADVNPLVPEAEALSWAFEREDRIENSITRIGDQWLDPKALNELSADLAASMDAVYAAARQGRDVPISTLLASGDRWHPLRRNLFQLMISEDAENTSSLGYADYDDTDVNWVVTGGLGALIERMGQGLPVRTGVAVTAISDHGSGVRVETSTGVIGAKAVIVTASTNLLLSGAIRFGAPHVAGLFDLMQDLPCGAYEKVALAFDRLPFDPADTLFCTLVPGQGRLPMGFMIVNGPHPKLVAHFGGSAAREMAALGADGMIAEAKATLALAFGSDVTRGIIAGAVTGWSANPWVRGAYSYARPGAGKSRRAMIGLDTGRIRFAGEAFSREAHATVHGAWASGRDVAGDLAASLNA